MFCVELHAEQTHAPDVYRLFWLFTQFFFIILLIIDPLTYLYNITHQASNNTYPHPTVNIELI